MSDVNSHSEPDLLLSPLEVLKNICDRMRVIWPFMEITALGVAGKEGLSELVNKTSGQLELLYGHEVLKERQLNDYSDITANCIKEFRPFFQHADLGKPEDLLAAVIPFKIHYARKYEESCYESDAPKSQIQVGLLCFWRNDKDEPIFDKRAHDTLNLIVSQFDSYCMVYNMLDTYSNLLQKFRHDLRTPLTSVTMISGLLEQQASDKEAQEMGQMLHTASDKMDGLLKAFKSGLDI